MTLKTGFAWLWLLTVAGAASAEERRAQKKEEPLPPRAIARIGNYRFFHGPGIECAVLSPDGTRVASAARYPIYNHLLSHAEKHAYECVIVVWDAATGERIRELKVAKGPVTHLLFSADGRRLIATGASSLAVLEVDTGKLVRRLDKLEGFGRRLSADGKQLFVLDYQHAITAREIETGKRLKSWKPPTGPSAWLKEREGVIDGMLSPDRKFMAWHVMEHPDYSKLPAGVIPPPPVRRATALVVADAETNKPLYRQEFAEGHLHALLFSPDGKRFLVPDKGLAAFETATGKRLFTLEADAYQFGLSADGRRAVVSDGGSNLTLWDLETRKRLHELCQGFLYVNSGTLPTPQVFSADGKALVLATHSTLRVFDVESGKDRATAAHRAPVTPRFSADGKTLFTTCSEERRSWDISSGQTPTLLTYAPRMAWEATEITHNNHDVFFLDQRERYDSRFRVRERSSGKLICELETGRGSIYGHFTPDARRVVVWQSGFAVGDFEGFQIYDAKTGKRTSQIPTVDRIGYYPAISPDSRIVAWPDRANAVHVQDAATGKLLRTLRSHRALPSKKCNDAGLVFSPDSAYLMVTTYDQELFSNPNDAEKWNTLPTRVFHVASGRELGRFYSNPDKTRSAARHTCAACSPDGRLFAVAEPESGTIRVIELCSGQVRAEFTGHRFGVHGLAFSPDGRTLASGGQDHITFLWDVIDRPAAANDRRDLPAWWADLAATDGKQAGVAIACFLRSPGPSAAFLKDRLRPASVDEKRVLRLLADFGDREFSKREAAARELAQLGDLAEVPLRQLLRTELTLESKRRTEELLAKMESSPLPPETLQALRAVEVLEFVGTPAARHVLETLAQGAPNARLTQHAAAALTRLGRKPAAEK
jgi:WD40 repeat protein